MKNAIAEIMLLFSNPMVYGCCPPGIRYWFHLQNYELILALPITLLVVRRQEYLDVLYSLLVLGEMLLPLRLPAQEFRPWLEVLG